MNDRIISNWISLAEYDLETARAMQKSGRYLYVVFTCQQAIEKYLKALYVKEKGETPPYTHNLTRLVEELSIAGQIDPKVDRFLERMNSYYIQSRYTEEIKEISRRLDTVTTREILDRTEEVCSWMRSQI
jgi:HEPN domain-containing protein